MTANTNESNSTWAVHNYCVAFIDLLGQKDVLDGQGLYKPPQTEEENKKFQDIVVNSIGAIFKLQRDAKAMLTHTLQLNDASPLRQELPPDGQQIWDQVIQTQITTQRWSDGLVSFSCLGGDDIKCKAVGVFEIFVLAGSLCLLGLARGHPIRGAIEIAWGVELHPGELYGPAVARSYELESQVAQYPRIVVGSEMITYLEANAARQEQDEFSQADRSFGGLCQKMLIQDVDGHWHLHYLGEAFHASVTRSQHAELYNLAKQFASDQYEKHWAKQNTKLAFRYVHLLDYFNAYPLTGTE